MGMRCGPCSRLRSSCASTTGSWGPGLIWRCVCQGGMLKFRRELGRGRCVAGVSGGRDVGLGDGVASLNSGFWLPPGPVSAAGGALGLGTSVALGGAAHSPIARAGRCVGPASRPPEPSAAVCVVQPCRLGCGRDGPEEARQLSRDRDDRDVVMLPAGSHRGVEVMQSLLRTIADLQDVVGLAVLAVLEVTPMRGSRA